MSWLPLKADLIEAHALHALLLRLVRDEDKNVIGANKDNLLRIVQLFSVMIGRLAVKATPPVFREICGEELCAQIAERKLPNIRALTACGDIHLRLQLV